MKLTEAPISTRYLFLFSVFTFSIQMYSTRKKTTILLNDTRQQLQTEKRIHSIDGIELNNIHWNIKYSLFKVVVLRISLTFLLFSCRSNWFYQQLFTARISVCLPLNTHDDLIFCARNSVYFFIHSFIRLNSLISCFWIVIKLLFLLF